MIDAHRGQFAVTRMARLLGVTAAGGYKPNLPADAVAMLDRPAGRGLSSWPEDMVAKIRSGNGPLQSWLGEECWEGDIA